MCVCVCVCVCVSPKIMSKKDVTQHKIHFKAKFNKFEFIFLSLWVVVIPKLKIPVCPTLYTWLERAIVSSLPFPSVLDIYG